MANIIPESVIEIEAEHRKENGDIYELSEIVSDFRNLSDGYVSVLRRQSFASEAHAAVGKSGSYSRSTPL